METRLKEVLAVVNNKGGVGKTTTVQSLAAALVRSHKDYRVLLVDLDQQCHLSLLHGVKHKNGLHTIYEALRDRTGIPVYKSHRDGVYICPSSPDMQSADVAITSKPGNPHRVLTRCFEMPFEDFTGEGLTNVFNDFDYVFIDCAPELSQSTYNAMVLATGLLVPVQIEGLAVNGMKNLMLAMRATQVDDNKNLELRGIILTMANQQLNITKELTDRLRETYGDNICKTIIHRNVKIIEAQTFYKDIYDYKQWSPVANDYDALSKELFG